MVTDVHAHSCSYRFMKKCSGNEQRMTANPNDWVTLKQAMIEFRHVDITLLKVDIEGGEYDVFSSWKIGSQHMPKQICVEIHYSDLVRAGNGADVPYVFFQPPTSGTCAPHPSPVGSFAARRRTVMQVTSQMLFGAWGLLKILRRCTLFRSISLSASLPHTGPDMK